MWKIFLMLTAQLIVISLYGCSNKGGNGEKMNDITKEEVSFVEIEQSGIDWDQIEFSIDLSTIDFFAEVKTIETKQDALIIGNNIIETCHEKNMFLDYTLLSIVFFKQDNIWRFDYSIDQRDRDIEEIEDCGNLYVAVRGRDGKLIKAWVEE